MIVRILRQFMTLMLLPQLLAGASEGTALTSPAGGIFDSSIDQGALPAVIGPYQLDPLQASQRDWVSVLPNLQERSGATFRWRGRIEVDSISVNQSAANKAAYGDLPDVTGLRRARVGAEGNFNSYSRYIAEIDLASGQVVMRDVYAGIGKIRETGEFKFGHMREPFSSTV